MYIFSNIYLSFRICIQVIYPPKFHSYFNQFILVYFNRQYIRRNTKQPSFFYILLFCRTLPCFINHPVKITASNCDPGRHNKGVPLKNHVQKVEIKNELFYSGGPRPPSDLIYFQLNQGQDPDRQPTLTYRAPLGDKNQILFSGVGQSPGLFKSGGSRRRVIASDAKSPLLTAPYINIQGGKICIPCWEWGGRLQL